MKICILCNSEHTYIDKNNRCRWYGFRDGYICQKCYNNKVLRPRLTTEQVEKYRKKFNNTAYRKTKKPLTKEQKKKCNDKQNPKKLVFKKKRIFLKENPRIGYCSICRNNIYDGTCKLTNIHHIKYHDDDPLKDTIELCASCHRIHHWEDRKVSK